MYMQKGNGKFDRMIFLWLICMNEVCIQFEAKKLEIIEFLQKFCIHSFVPLVHSNRSEFSILELAKELCYQ